MKINYRGCEIEAYRENRNSDLFYSVFDNGYEVTSGYSEGNDAVRDWIKDLKHIVDYYIDEYKSDNEKWENRDDEI